MLNNFLIADVANTGIVHVAMAPIVSVGMVTPMIGKFFPIIKLKSDSTKLSYMWNFKANSPLVVMPAHTSRVIFALSGCVFFGI